MVIENMLKCLNDKDLSIIFKYLNKERNKNYMVAANAIINNQYFMVPPFKHKIEEEVISDWDNDERYSRSLLRLLNGFTFIGDLIAAYDSTKNEEYIIKGFDIAEQWLKFKDYDKHKNSMLFHDETTALRMEYLLALVIKGINIVETSRIVTILNELNFTAALLVDDSFHTKNTNHGMFQDLALLKYAIVFDSLIESNTYMEVSNKRLVEYFEMIFTSEGIHKEHSPLYHLMITTNLKRYINLLKDCNLPNAISTNINKLFLMAEKYIIYITRPDGCVPNISDTEIRKLKDCYPNLFNSDEYKYVLSEGKEGIKPKNNNIVFKESGYAIFRDDWEKGSKGSQVIFTAAYNAGYHKHTDDLNVLFYCGKDILVEAGANGYNYKDPFTKYAYSANAHNTLNVKNKPLLRHDEQYDKVKILDYKLENSFSEVVGINDRYENVTHKRKVKYFSNKNILEVSDDIRSNEINNYILNWHFAKGLSLEKAKYGFDIIENDKIIGIVKIEASVPYEARVINGREGKSPQGWYFDKMESKSNINNIEVLFDGKNARFITQIIIFSGEEKDYEFDIYRNEKAYYGEERIKYLFKEAEDSDKLCVVFSAISEKNKYVYNYMHTLSNCKINQLFILDDFGIQGSYYLGKNRSKTIENSVRSLIFSIIKEKNINLNDVILIGSSKGGYSALYYGIKYNFGNVIVGAPQSKLGDFLIDQGKHYDVANYIAGTISEESKEYLNNILFKTIEDNSKSSTKIYIHIGKGDYHYEKHVKPLCSELDLYKFNYILDVENYRTHSETKIYYPIYLKRILNKIDNRIIDIKDIEEISREELILTNVNLSYNNGVLQSSIEYNYIHDINEMDKSLLYAYYVFKDDECIYKGKYSKNNEFSYETSSPGNYRVRGYVKNRMNKISSRYSKTINIK